MIPAFLAQLGLSAAAPIFKGIAGLFQTNQEVKKRDTRPEAFKESLDLTRQQAGSNRLPGQAEAENRIAQGTAAVNAGALRAGGSSSDVLGALAASDAQQQQSLAGLTSQATAYNQQQQGELKRGLAQDAAYQQRDQENYEKEKADVKEGGLRNLFGAVDGLAQVGAYGLNRGQNFGLSQRGDFSGLNDGGLDKSYDLPDGSGYPRRRTQYDVFGRPISAALSGLAG